MTKLWYYLEKLIRLLGLQNVVLIEAEKAIRENTEAVFREMILRGWEKCYRIVLLSQHPELLQGWPLKKVVILPWSESSIKGILRFRYRWYRLRALLIVDENTQVRKNTSSTIHVYLSHGSPMKRLRGYYQCSKDTDYMLNQSDFWKPINSYEFGIAEEKLITLGFPRNDALFTHSVDMITLFGSEYQRVVTWYPTYRQHQGKKTNQIYQGNTAIPLIQDQSFAVKLNQIAAQHGILLVIKPHPAQDVSKIREMNLSNLRYINDDFFIAQQTTTYHFLADTDALITDCSSVLFDYLLTDKPIGFAFEDYEQYKEQVGFAMDMDIVRSCCAPLNTLDDFENFFRDLVTGNDPLREKREALKHLTNQYTDSNSAKRVVDWLETLLKT